MLGSRFYEEIQFYCRCEIFETILKNVSLEFQSTKCKSYKNNYDYIKENHTLVILTSFWSSLAFKDPKAKFLIEEHFFFVS